MALYNQLDPTDGLIDFVQAVKPYHTKILEISIEHFATDEIRCQVGDNAHLTITFMDVAEEDRHVEYTCGYGLVWNAYGNETPSELPFANLVEAKAYPDNVLIVDMPVQTKFPAVVTSLRADQLMLATQHAISSATIATRQWIVPGNQTARLNKGDPFYVTSNHDTVNGGYTVDTATFSAARNQTTIISREPIPSLLQAGGAISIPMDVSDIPYWPVGMRVKISSTGDLPAPLVADGKYCFSPSAKYGAFNLSDIRYPRERSQMIDLTSFGTGALTIERAEPFVPGEQIMVSSGGQNIAMTVQTIKSLGNGRFEIAPIEQVDTQLTGGTVKYNGSFGDPYCAIAYSPPLHAETIIREQLIFTHKN